MGALDRLVLAERSASVERHLARVAARLPKNVSEFTAPSDVADAVILHLWQAVQIVIDLGLSACLHFNLGTPESYGDAFRRLAAASLLEQDLARRLTQAAGFRNLVAHAYEELDLVRVHRIATDGPTDLRTFLARLRDLLT
jgi:uncharacterized protein YutE (UPF0331/DUF86 family)